MFELASGENSGEIIQNCFVYDTRVWYFNIIQHSKKGTMSAVEKKTTIGN